MKSSLASRLTLPMLSECGNSGFIDLILATKPPNAKKPLGHLPGDRFAGTDTDYTKDRRAKGFLTLSVTPATLPSPRVYAAPK